MRRRDEQRVLLVNIDVDDLERGIAFYTRAFALQIGRRLGPDAVELLGAEAPIFLLEKPAGSTPFRDATRPRDYARHWTPVHLDFTVPDVEAALERALQAGARVEHEIAAYDWGKMVVLADPFGHGFCLVQLSRRGYDALSG